MPRPHSLPPSSPEAVLSLSPDVLDLLFATFGAPPGAQEGALAAARDIFEGRGTARLERAVAFVDRFGGDLGRRAFCEGGRSAGDPRAASWLGERPADVAAKVAIERATAKGRARRMIERIAALCLLRMERELNARPRYEILMTGRSPSGESVARTLRRELHDVVFDVWFRVTADGALYLAVFTRTPVLAPLLVERGKIHCRVNHGMAVDLVRISPDGRRISFTLATPELLLRYVSTLALALRSSFTLKPLHDITPEDLARVVAQVPGVRAITVIGVRERGPDGTRFEMRTHDLLHDAAGRGPRPVLGYVDRATIRIDVGECIVDVFLQLPHRLEISNRAYESIVRAVLVALGLFDPGMRPDDARSLAYYTHPDWRWRDVIDDAGFEANVRRGLLVQVEVAHVSTEEMRMHGASFVVRSVPGEPGVEYALAEDRAYGARIVGPEQRVAWRLDVEALAAAMSADLGAVRPDKGTAIAVEGVLDLGTVVLASGKLRFVYAMATPPKAWLESVRRACGVGVTLVVLVPRGHGRGMDGVLVLELDVGEQFGVKPIGRVLGRAAVALDVAGEVDLWRTCEEDVVIDAASERTWVKGVEVPLSDTPYRLAEMLARAGHVMATKEIGEKLTSGEYPVEAARRIKMKLEAQVSEALAKAGVELGVESFVVAEGKKGYRLALSARVIG